MSRIYTDENFYKINYLLGKEPVITAGFLFFSMQASRIIDSFTFNRLLEESEITENVKMCCCELAESLFLSEQNNDLGNKTSEKIGSYLVHFESKTDTLKTDRIRQKSIITKWLANTGLLYSGV